MAKFRTKKSDRSTYIYFDAYGRKVAELIPGENGVTEAMIAELHAWDDGNINVAKQEAYYGVGRFPENEDGELIDDRDSRFADYRNDPLTRLIADIESAERAGRFREVWISLSDKQRELVVKKLRKMSNVEIAAEEGVWESAIRHRLERIQKRFAEFVD